MQLALKFLRLISMLCSHVRLAALRSPGALLWLCSWSACITSVNQLVQNLLGLTCLWQRCVSLYLACAKVLLKGK